MWHDAARAARVKQVVRKLEADGVDAVWVDRAPVFDRTTLLHALYQALQLPAWFGFNWDALEECLLELNSTAGRPVVLVFNDFELLEERNPGVAHTFLEIVGTVTDEPGRFFGIVRVRDVSASEHHM